MKRLFISLAILAGISLSSCNDSFLEKTPVTVFITIEQPKLIRNIRV